MKPKVLLAIPTLGSVKDQCIISVIRALGHYGNCKLAIRAGKPIDHNRNVMVQENFLGSDADYLMFVDSDVVIPETTISDLMALDKPVAAGVYLLGKLSPAGEISFSYACGDFSGDPDNPLSVYTGGLPREPFKTELFNAGCSLVRRDVFEKMPKPWYLHHYLNTDTLLRMHEDGWFCKQLKELNIEAWTHPGVYCDHIHEMNMNPVALAIQETTYET